MQEDDKHLDEEEENIQEIEGEKLDIDVDEILSDYKQLDEYDIDRDETEILPESEDSIGQTEDPIGTFEDSLDNPIKGLTGCSYTGPMPPIVNDPLEELERKIQNTKPLQRELTNPVRDDPLVGSIKREEPTIILFNNILLEIAEELAYLKSTRHDSYITNQNFADISFKRVKSLRELVEVIIKREQQKEGKSGKIDFYGEQFEKVMTFFLQKVSDSFERAGIPNQYHDIFFAQLSQDLEGFEKKVEKIYYGKE